MRCKECNAVISIGLESAIGEFEMPKEVNRESVKQSLCKECYEAKVS